MYPKIEILLPFPGMGKQIVYIIYSPTQKVLIRIYDGSCPKKNIYIYDGYEINVFFLESWFDMKSMVDISRTDIIRIFLSSHLRLSYIASVDF